MSLSSAMHAAMSGLTAVSRATTLVSENIANATTPGYGRRTLALSSQGDGRIGVQINGIVRHGDPVLISYRRAADADLLHADAQVGFFSRLGDLTGSPDSPLSIPSRIVDLEGSLLSAASRPDLGERLDDVAVQASELATSLRQASDGVQDTRAQADQTIAGMVESLNASLSQLQDINTRITRDLASGNGVAGLQDQRQTVVDQINNLVPVTVVDRPGGQVALYTQGGAILLDGVAAEVGFTASGAFGPSQTIEGGSLSGLTINGIAVRTASTDGALRGGALGAQFAIRDEWAVAAQADLDAVARDLVERFQDPAVDPTLASGDAGLFTDAGSAFDPLNETGLAERLQLNATADPAQGGESWRLRDGLGATAPGEPGQTGLLVALSDALATPRIPSSGSFGTGAVSAGSLGAALVAGTQQHLANAESQRSFAAATQFDLSQKESQLGVDTDAELQSLLVLEQAYAANAQVISAIDEMMAEILRI